jgi:hypothetical protein
MSSVLPAKTVSSIRCRIECAFDDRASTHHDRMLDVEDDFDALLELLELAVTWGELDYSDAGVIAPSQWEAFVAQHRWNDPARCERLFALAADVARHSQVCAAAGPSVPATR